MSASAFACLSAELPEFNPSMAPGLEGGDAVLVSAGNGEAESHGDKANVSIFAPSGSAVGVAAGSSPTSVSAPLGKPGTLGEAFDLLIFPRTCGTPFWLDRCRRFC